MIKSKLPKEKFIKDAYHTCEFVLNLMLFLKENEEVGNEDAIAKTFSLYFSCLVPYEKFLIELKFFGNEAYEEIFYYAEKLSKLYPYACNCKFCSN